MSATFESLTDKWAELTGIRLTQIFPNLFQPSFSTRAIHTLANISKIKLLSRWAMDVSSAVAIWLVTVVFECRVQSDLKHVLWTKRKCNIVSFRYVSKWRSQDYGWTAFDGWCLSFIILISFGCWWVPCKSHLTVCAGASVKRFWQIFGPILVTCVENVTYEYDPINCFCHGWCSAVKMGSVKLFSDQQHGNFVFCSNPASLEF